MRWVMALCAMAVIGASAATGCSEERVPAPTEQGESTRAAGAPEPATTPKPTAAPKPVSGKAVWEARKRVARPVVPSDKLHLLRTSGSVEGPIPYLVVAPAEAAPDIPIVLALHGRGDRADAFARLAEQVRVPMRFIVCEAPMPWGARGGRRWFDMSAPDLPAQLTARVDDLVTLAEKVAKRWPEAPKPMLLGFSQGAMLSLQAIAQRPAPFAGAIALSGALLTPDGHPKSAVSLPVFLTAGSRDRVVKPERARDAAAALEALGHETEVLDFEGGHGVTPDVMAHIRRVLREWQTGDKPASPGAD